MSYPKPLKTMPDYTEQVPKLKSLKLTPAQRKKLLINHRQEEIKTLIINKFLEKKRIFINNDKYLIQIISSFLSKNKKLNEKDLESLAKHLQLLISNKETQEKIELKQIEDQKKNKKNEIEKEITQKTINEIEPTEKSKKKLKIYQNGKEMEYELSDTESEKSVYKTNDEENEWAAIVRFKQKKYEEDLQKEKEKHQAKKNMFKQELDSQLKLKNQLKKKENDYELQESENLKSYNQQQEIKLKQREEAKRKLIEENKKAKDEQLKNILIRQRIERKQELEFDKLLIEKAKQELLSEQELQKKKKLSYKESLNKIASSNYENKKKILDSEFSAQKEVESKAIEEDTNLTTRRENQKFSEKIARQAKLELLQKCVSDQYVKNLEAQKKKEEQILIKNLEEIEKKTIEKEKKKIEKQNEWKGRLKQSLEIQIQEKQLVKKREQSENLKQAEFWKNDIEMYKKEEFEKINRMKTKNQETLQIVKKQIEDDRKKKEIQKTMNDLELLQNKEILREIALTENDENKSVLQKIRISPHKRI